MVGPSLLGTASGVVPDAAWPRRNSKARGLGLSGGVGELAKPERDALMLRAARRVPWARKENDPFRITVSQDCVLELDLQESGDSVVLVSPDQTSVKALGPGERLPVFVSGDSRGKGSWMVFRDDSKSKWDRATLIAWSPEEARYRQGAFWWNP